MAHETIAQTAELGGNEGLALPILNLHRDVGDLLGNMFKTPSRPVGLMDQASASGAGDSRFESWEGHCAQLQSLSCTFFYSDIKKAHPNSAIV